MITGIRITGIDPKNNLLGSVGPKNQLTFNANMFTLVTGQAISHPAWQTMASKRTKDQRQWWKRITG